MKKRGQVTIFIIIAIIVIGAIVTFFTFQDQIKSLFTSQEDSIYLFVETCIKDVGQDAIYLTSQKGGYFISPELSTSKGIAYYYINGENNLPSQKIIEEQISFYIKNMLSLCTQNFSDFPDFEISQEQVDVETDIKNEEIMFDVKYPLTIKKEDSVTRIEDFENIKIPIRLGIIYNTAKEIIQNQLTRDDLCISCISNIALENDLKIDLTAEDEDLLFTITDENSLIKNVPLKFSFANKYP